VPLVERDIELDRLQHAISRAESGHGSALVIEGPPGIGKTALLEAGSEMAALAGMVTLSTRAVELESGWGFSTVRDLLTPTLASLEPGDRDAVLDGAARLAQGPLGLGTAPVDLGAAIHACYWLCANLAERQPMMLTIDDAHWADEASLAFLAYLSRRVSELPLVVCITMRPAELEPAVRSLTALRSEAVHLLHPAPLSVAGVARVLEHGLDERAEPAFSEACAAASGGNPFLVVETLEAVRHHGVRPITAEAKRIEHLRPETLAPTMLARVARLGPEARSVAGATAILGPDADLRRVAALAELSPESVAQAVAGLRREGILTAAERLEFVHPLIRTAVYADVAEPDRGLGHLSAAKILDRDGELSRVPSHLLVADRHGDTWVTDRLRNAAGTALSAGSPGSAAALLERALAEPAPEGDRAALRVDLGRAYLRSGEFAGAVSALERVIEEPGDASLQRSAALELGRALRLAGRIPESVAVFDEAIRGLPPGHHEEEIELETEIAIASHMGMPASEWVDRLASAVERAPGMSLAERTMRSMYAYVAASTGSRTADDVAALARSCIDSDGAVSPTSLQGVAAGLAMSGAFAEALDVLDRSLAIAHELGDASQVGFVLFTRTWVANRAGRVLEGEADARALLDAPGVSEPYVQYATAHLIVALIDRGAISDAEALLERQGLAETTDLNGLLGAVLHIARSRLHRARGRPRHAVADFERCRAVLEEVGFTGPSFGEWRMDGALSYLALGDRTAAREIAVEDVEVSQAFGGGRELGIALRTLGLVEGGARGLELLADSVDVLADSEAALDHAKSLIEHGAALRRAGKGPEARDQLSRGLDVASRCGATAAVNRARDELTAAGARPRRERTTGPDSLTASELRVARLAAKGHSNPEIAQALFVTRRTVEVHLTHVYRKLGIDSRGALVSVLSS
jgi:DNA-binding CsgD family transcriptional regulator/tetratricopeptide (TPR) repeat protein